MSYQNPPYFTNWPWPFLPREQVGNHEIRQPWAQSQTLELGGQIYQYFLVTVHMGAPSQSPFDPPADSSPMLGQPIAGPFASYLEAEEFGKKILIQVQLLVVPLPLRLFGRGGR